MTQNEFVKVIEELDSLSQEILMGKGKEYASDFDRLANFKDIGKKFAIDPRVVLWVYLEKHLRALGSTLIEGKISIESHTRIADCINYLKLLYALEHEMVSGSEMPQDKQEELRITGILAKYNANGLVPIFEVTSYDQAERTANRMQKADSDIFYYIPNEDWAYFKANYEKDPARFNLYRIPLNPQGFHYNKIMKEDEDFYADKVITADEYIPDPTHDLPYKPQIGKDNNDKPMHGSELIR